MEINNVHDNKGSNYSVEKTAPSEKTKPESVKVEEKSGAIQGSELNLGGQQDTTLKKLLSQRAAWQAQLDQFDKDLKMDEVITGHEDARETYKVEASTNQQEVSRLNDLTKDAKDSYGVDDGSIEQKDLELLQKQLWDKEPLTEEERNSISEMGPLTEYQKIAMEYTSMAKVFQTRADSAVQGAENESRTISAIKLELLKSQPMVEAKKLAEDFLVKVDEEIQLALLEEIKSRVSENLNIDPNTQILTDPQALINQKKATEEDLKGLAVDEKV